jgi:hypothetical protein
MDINSPTPQPRPTGARIGPEDYVAEEAFPRILELIEESSRREAEQVAKRRSCRSSSSTPSPLPTSSRPPSTPPPPTGM